MICVFFIVVNIMAMDYGSDSAPNGATGMGGYAISAAQATYAQVNSVGLSSKIGITPMIGQNDVADEIFRVADATQLVNFAKSTSWVSFLAFWSINRDTSVQGPLYASSQISQNTFDFANVFKSYTSSGGSTGGPGPSPTPAPTKNVPSPVPLPPLSPQGYQWPNKIYAPYVDATAWPTFDIVAMSNNVGTQWYTLAFIVSDGSGNPSWGGYYGLSTGWYKTQMDSVRQFGGEIIISFGGASGTELAFTNTNVNTLKEKYQSVVNTYACSWLDFDIEGSALTDKASVDRRNQALRALQIQTPGIRISYTLPVFPSGLTSDGVYVLQSAYNAGVRVDVVNIMAMDYGSSVAPNGASGMGDYAIQAAKATYNQVKSVGLNSKIGITPMIGKNDVQGEVFTLTDADKLYQFALSQSWVAVVSAWSAGRDKASVTGVSQADFAYSSIFVAVY